MPKKTKPTPRPPFRLLDAHSRAGTAFDEPGLVRVYIRLVSPNGRFVKGNVARSLTVQGATVTEVFRVVHKALAHA